ncbi:hypothetical protein Y032_0068g151 [Ancylostoma ceylanicum]|uniref:Uncharacterized protein n=1 Tax=Ancylostoma ceylanicum TaxID=53326 RepID=A0A016TXN8_9BILA|nr:hypothetical protein Y032_0068g151 [Ancylostoma ceylanicum]
MEFNSHNLSTLWTEHIFACRGRVVRGHFSDNSPFASPDDRGMFYGCEERISLDAFNIVVENLPWQEREYKARATHSISLLVQNNQ